MTIYFPFGESLSVVLSLLHIDYKINIATTSLIRQKILRTQPFFSLLIVGLFVFSLTVPNYVYSQAFRVVNFGDDVLAVGAGARALGMGSAFSAVSNDVTAAYWNPASLVRLSKSREVAYMHSERFGGAVAYDYAAYAQILTHLKKPTAVAISLFRQGVDGIKNTTNAWDVARNLPRPNPEQYFTSFSASDMAMLLTFAQQQNERLSIGGNVKVLYSRLGPFANGLGYSIDLSAFYSSPFADLAIQVQNVTGLLKFWQINADEFGAFTDSGDEIPTGENEWVRPSIRFGAAKQFLQRSATWDLLMSFDTQLRFENRQTFYLNVGPMSIEPNLGFELGYQSLLFARFGLTDLTTNWTAAVAVSPTIGAGIRLGKIQVDYAFASFAGPTVDLGYTHRISVIAGW
jgi:hypothetical protein